MDIRNEKFREENLLFLLAFLASFVLHGLVFIYFQKPEKDENILKNESVELFLLRAHRDTEAVRETSANTVYPDFQAELESKSIEKQEIASIDPFLKDISEKTAKMQLNQDLSVLIRKNIPQTSKIERDLNNRVLTVSSKEEIPIHARLYLNSWERKIERIGNLNYPKNATANNLHGSLELLVSILPSGELSEIRLIESSGHRILDKAAISIVEMASPFAPFPEEMLQSIDLIEIIRIWDFRKNASWSF